VEREGGRGEERVDVENVLDSDLFTDKSLQIPEQSGGVDAEAKVNDT